MKAKVIKTGEIVDVYHEPQHGQITNIYKESVLVNGRMWTEDELDFCMEANRAPEKIYLDEDESWHLTNPNGDSVEYTRTDAFIEKAAWWLLTNASDYVILHNGYDTKELVKDFVDAMKRE